MSLADPICLRHRRLSRICLMAQTARAVCRLVLAKVPVAAVFPDGTRWGGGAHDPEAPVMQIVRPADLFERIAHHPKIGIGEAYMAGDWCAADGTDLADLLSPFAEQLADLVPKPLQRLRGVIDQRLPHHTRNTVGGARRNIEAHYDLSNELFAQFLDPTMTYSSALFDTSGDGSDESLQQAQERKLRRALDVARVDVGTRVLEIGTGWGSLAVEAARRGAEVTSITLSSEQRAWADQRLVDEGLDDRVTTRLQDYRETDGRYDAVVSIEMIEAVGEEYWPTYFRTLDARLERGGTAVVQAILMAHERYRATRNSYGWIQKYIFPGGLIPSLEAIHEIVGEHTRLCVTEVHSFGRDYAETLRRWRVRFLDNWTDIAPLGFDDAFRRQWEFYLAYCEAGFASGYLDVAQIRLDKPATR